MADHDPGSYSVVERRDNPNALPVRARTREDPEALGDLVPSLAIDENAGSDYRFRAVVPRDVWQKTVATLAAEIDYATPRAGLPRMGHDRAAASATSGRR